MSDSYVVDGSGAPTIQKVEVGGTTTYAFLSQGGSISTSNGHLVSLIVSEGSDANGTALTLTLWDNSVSGGTAIITAFPVLSGNIYDFQNVEYGTGLFATITNSATSSYALTVLYRDS